MMHCCNGLASQILPPLPLLLQASSSDPTLPLGAAICYCGYKLYDKRSRRMGSTDPERTPIWGALGSTLLALVLGGVFRCARGRALRRWGGQQ